MKPAEMSDEVKVMVQLHDLPSSTTAGTFTLVVR